MWKTIYQYCWGDRTFGTKLSVLLVSATAIPIVLITYGILQVAENKLLSSLQDKLQESLILLEQEIKQVEQNDRTEALNLEKSIQLAQWDWSDPNFPTTQSAQLNLLLRSTEQDANNVSVLILTDAQGRSIAQRNWSLSPAQAAIVPPASAIDLTELREITSSESLRDLPIVSRAFETKETRSGTVLLNPAQLKQLGLLEQAHLGIQPQKIAGLPPEKQPAPLGTYETYQGQLGLVTLAVRPIQVKGQFVGSVIVASLINGDRRIVDRVKQNGHVSTATIFAQDWRVSTNVLLPDQQTRAFGTRAASEVSKKVLDQGQPFSGRTNIVGQTYLTAYKPLYGDRSPQETKPQKPIGILYVGDPETQVQQTLSTIAWRGYGIGGGILLLVGLLASPIARSLIASDQKMRQQTQELQDTLIKLKDTQSQLVQTEKMSSLGQLVAGVAHEINNPVNFIYGNLTYLKDYVNHLLELIHTYQCQYPKPTPAIEEVIERIEFDFIKTDLPQLLSSMYVGSSRIKEIVLSLRNFSRFDEAGYKSVNLKEGLDSTLVILQHRLKATERRSEIKILRTYDSIPTIECYAGLLNQVFMNILANAIDAMDEYYDFRNSPTGRAAQPQLDITIQQIDQDWVAVLLRDNGAGMSPETQQHLFDPFFTTKPVGKGTGLGLSISYQIVVDRHRGHLSCRSVPVLEGGGTEFTVKIPMRSVVS